MSTPIPLIYNEYVLTQSYKIIPATKIVVAEKHNYSMRLNYFI
jgi:hypothetical protein